MKMEPGSRGTSPDLPELDAAGRRRWKSHIESLIGARFQGQSKLAVDVADRCGDTSNDVVRGLEAEISRFKNGDEPTVRRWFGRNRDTRLVPFAAALGTTPDGLLAQLHGATRGSVRPRGPVAESSAAWSELLADVFVAPPLKIGYRDGSPAELVQHYLDALAKPSTSAPWLWIGGEAGTGRRTLARWITEQLAAADRSFAGVTVLESCPLEGWTASRAAHRAPVIACRELRDDEWSAREKAPQDVEAHLEPWTTAHALSLLDALVEARRVAPDARRALATFRTALREGRAALGPDRRARAVVALLEEVAAGATPADPSELSRRLTRRAWQEAGKAADGGLDVYDEWLLEDFWARRFRTSELPDWTTLAETDALPLLQSTVDDTRYAPTRPSSVLTWLDELYRADDRRRAELLAALRIALEPPKNEALLDVLTTGGLLGRNDRQLYGDPLLAKLWAARGLARSGLDELARDGKKLVHPDWPDIVEELVRSGCSFERLAQAMRLAPAWASLDASLTLVRAAVAEGAPRVPPAEGPVLVQAWADALWLMGHESGSLAFSWDDPSILRTLSERYRDVLPRLAAPRFTEGLASLVSDGARTFVHAWVTSMETATCEMPQGRLPLSRIPGGRLAVLDESGLVDPARTRDARFAHLAPYQCLAALVPAADRPTGGFEDAERALEWAAAEGDADARGLLGMASWTAGDGALLAMWRTLPVRLRLRHFGAWGLPAEAAPLLRELLDETEAPDSEDAPDAGVVEDLSRALGRLPGLDGAAGLLDWIARRDGSGRTGPLAVAVAERLGWAEVLVRVVATPGPSASQNAEVTTVAFAAARALSRLGNPTYLRSVAEGRPTESTRWLQDLAEPHRSALRLQAARDLAVVTDDALVDAWVRHLGSDESPWHGVFGADEIAPIVESWRWIEAAWRRLAGAGVDPPPSERLPAALDALLARTEAVVRCSEDALAPSPCLPVDLLSRALPPARQKLWAWQQALRPYLNGLASRLYDAARGTGDRREACAWALIVSGEGRLSAQAADELRWWATEDPAPFSGDGPFILSVESGRVTGGHAQLVDALRRLTSESSPTWLPIGLRRLWTLALEAPQAPLSSWDDRPESEIRLDGTACAYVPGEVLADLLDLTGNQDVFPYDLREFGRLSFDSRNRAATIGATGLRKLFWDRASNDAVLSLLETPALDPSVVYRGLSRLEERSVAVPADVRWQVVDNFLSKIFSDPPPREHLDWIVDLATVIHPIRPTQRTRDLLERLAASAWASDARLPYLVGNVEPNEPESWAWQVCSRRCTLAVAERMEHETTVGGEA